MMGIGGNTTANIQLKTRETMNHIGEREKEWETVQTLVGWLDMTGGSSAYTTFDAKVQESSHFFIADYVPLDSRIKAETCRFVIDGDVYDVMLMDNPMGMGEGSQWEIYLKYTGGR